MRRLVKRISLGALRCASVILLCSFAALTFLNCAGGKRAVTGIERSRIATTASITTSMTPRAIILEREISGKLYGKNLSSPGAIRQDHSGVFYLIDRGNQRIVKLDSAFFPLADFGGANTGGGRLRAPNRAAPDGRGNVFLTDTELREIIQFDADLNLVREIPFLDTADALEFGTPGGLAVDKDGMLWVSDYDRSRLAVFDRFGVFKEFYADYNSGGSHLERPGAMFPLAQGGMVVCDEREGQALLFNSYGVQRGVIGKGILRAPVDVGVDGDGRIWICDSALAEILCFSGDGELLFRTGDLGAAYNIRLSSPLGICVRKNDTLIICDSGADRILICRIIVSA